MRNRVKAIFILLVLMVPSTIFAGDGDRWQLLALGGVFSPIDKEVQNIYGASFTGNLAITAPLGKRGRIRLGGNLLERQGDPFYQSRDFYLPDAGKLSLRSISMTLETHARTTGNPRLYIGGGVDYFFGREKLNGLDTSEGGAIGAHLSLTPEVRVTSTVALVAEASYQFLEITFKTGRERYKFNLSGAKLLAGLAFQLGN
ncbi:hypothetical protein MJD09_00420 [bacterium]|nr:hypothetical protein [bacterium]